MRILQRVAPVVAVMLVAGLAYAADPKPSFEQANAAAKSQTKAAEGPSIMGLKPGPARGLVMANCIGCHSPKLITQHHLSRERWAETMEGMRKHGFWELPEPIKKMILDYLAETQGPLGDKEFKETPWAQPLYQPNPIWK